MHKVQIALLVFDVACFPFSQLAHVGQLLGFELPPAAQVCDGRFRFSRICKIVVVLGVIVYTNARTNFRDTKMGADSMVFVYCTQAR